MNIQKIRRCFYQGKVWTKTELASVTQLSLASITNILQELLKSQEILFIGEMIQQEEENQNNMF